MREYRLIIPGTLPSLNELIDAERTHRQKGAAVKKKAERIVRACIWQQLRGIKPRTPVKLHYYFYEKNRRRDLDNVFSMCAKVVQDSLVKEGVLKNDGWEYIDGFTAQFFVDGKFPRIEIVIEENNKA